eukprot:2858773-Amphidinium_carterae.1
MLTGVCCSVQTGLKDTVTFAESFVLARLKFEGFCEVAHIVEVLQAHDFVLASPTCSSQASALVLPEVSLDWSTIGPEIITLQTDLQFLGN